MSIAKVRDIMVHHTIFIKSISSLQEAAKTMKDADCAILPVGSPDSLEGVITDRDLVIQAIINGDHFSKRVGDYMNKQVTFCYEDDSLDVAADKMSKHHLHRLIVKNKQNSVTGILLLKDVMKFKTDHKQVF